MTNYIHTIIISSKKHVCLSIIYVIYRLRARTKNLKISRRNIVAAHIQLYSGLEKSVQKKKNHLLIVS